MAPITRRSKKYFTLRYHGNYVGPGWSDGKYQDSVAYGKRKPVDEFDATAYWHDTAYALGKDRNRADEEFYAANIGKSFKRTAAALAVMAQRKLRGNVVTGTEVGFPVKSFLPQKESMARSHSPGNRSRRNGSRGRSPTLRYGAPPVTPARSRSRRSSTVPATVRSMLARSRSRAPIRVDRGTSAPRRVRFQGAAMSSSSGRFPKKGKKTYTNADKFLKSGVVYARESSGVLTTTFAEKAQAVLVGHSSLSKIQLVNDISLAYAKWFATTVLKTQIINFSDTIEQKADVYFFYKTHAGAVVSSTAVYSIINSTTWLDIAANFVGVMGLANAQTGFQFCYMTVYGLTAAGSQTSSYKYDLTKMKFDVYSKSALKIQNRTVNNAANVEEDDVDNVPLYGKFYSGNGNYIEVDDTIIGTGPFSDTISSAPVVTAKFTASYLQQMREPQPLSVVRKATGIGKVHLSPGSIKTSLLSYRQRFGLNYIVTMLARTGNDLTAATCQIFPLGKFKFFHMEKMIQAVGTTDANAITVAYEVDFKCGAICTAPRINQSNMIIAIQNA